MNRLPIAALTALLALAAASPAGAVTAPTGERPLRNIDVRRADGGPTTASERRARRQLERELGDEGIVSTDRVNGGARMVARTDGALTGRRSAPPDDVALGYVRARPDVFGLDDSDLGGLRRTSRDRLAGGGTHLSYVQTYEGIAAYDNVLLANVDEDGRLLNVGGAAVSDLRVDSTTPARSAGDALGVAKREVGGSLVPPRARQASGPERSTRFSSGDTARLTLFDDGTTTRLAWKLLVTGDHGFVYELVVDATSGRVLKRRSLTEFASVYRNHPGAVNGGTPTAVDFVAQGWLQNTATTLDGINAHAYVDADAVDVLPPAPSGGDVEIPPGPGNAWNYAITPFNLPGCPPAPERCTWNAGVPSSRTTNRNQAATQLFYDVNTFHDHLAAAPISFTTRNFEGADRVMAETDNYLNPDGQSPTSTDNARMTTFPDGTPPRMEMFLFTNRSLNGADTADVVYHEYTHGLTNRLVGSGTGLDAPQSRAMGEGWSDWYALDFLEQTGLRPDSGGSTGDMTIGDYLQPGGLRRQGADCPVGPPSAGCPDGGYTLGDMGSVGANGFEVHDDGEIWLETLWDLRDALGVTDARRLITAGLSLSPNNPSFLEARDAIVLADRTIDNGANALAIWQVFAGRGMGYSATTSSSAATTANAASDLPPRLVHESTAVTDPAGDNDSVAEPGETVEIVEELRNPFALAVNAISGVLTAPGAAVPQNASAWPNIPGNATGSNVTPFQVTIPPAASCDSTQALSLALSTSAGAVTVPFAIPIGSRTSEDAAQAITPGPTGITSTVTFPGSGPVQDLEVRISRLAHTWVGDLVVELEHAGTTVTLMNRPGAGPDGASGNDFADLVLDDDAATAIENIPDAGPPGGYTGRFRPDGTLSDFDGDDRLGVWTLTVRDAFTPLDSGTLYGWGVRPSNAAPCPNRAPLAGADEYSTPGNTPLTAGPLANDADPDGDTPLTAVSQSDPPHGSVSISPSGTSMTYTPDPGFRGVDSFTYRARDPGGLESQPATVTVNVGNTPPVAADDAYTVVAGTTLNGSAVLANDSDPNGDALTASQGSAPEHGTLSLAGDGTFQYTPDAGFTGRDAFTYTASDGSASSAAVTATITVSAPPVTPPPPPPVAPPPPVVGSTRSPAKIEVLRAGVTGGRLDVLAAITAKASGKVRVGYRSAGRTTSFEAPISNGRIRFRQSLPRSQRAKSTGIFTLNYAGNPLVEPDSVTLRAASGKARLALTSSRISSNRLLVAGTISPRARGVVRVRLAFTAGGASKSLDFRAKIAAGKWSLNGTLPAAAAAAGGQLSIQFTGYEPLRIRGEQIARAVAPGG